MEDEVPAPTHYDLPGVATVVDCSANCSNDAAVGKGSFECSDLACKSKAAGSGADAGHCADVVRATGYVNVRATVDDYGCLEHSADNLFLCRTPEYPCNRADI